MKTCDLSVLASPSNHGWLAMGPGRPARPSSGLPLKSQILSPTGQWPLPGTVSGLHATGLRRTDMPERLMNAVMLVIMGDSMRYIIWPRPVRLCASAKVNCI